MAVPITLDDNTVYATKDNIQRPGTQAAADAAETLAEGRVADAFAESGVTIVVPAGAIKIES